MDILENIQLLDCPICGGAGILEEEYGWCIYVSCLDCGCHTAEFEFRSDDERLETARRAADIWNMGKVVSGNPGE